jgi:hypothetical protein
MRMNRLLPPARLTLLLLAAPAAHAARGFSSGVTAGEVTASSAGPFWNDGGVGMQCSGMDEFSYGQTP